ncbi:hypothetical protein [Paenibacillus phoenicis]|uniref:hypothetical protein n=1 Tax=Paenibacillus phoenicis TaxID=554117 RepID=UPI003D2A42CC
MNTKGIYALIFILFLLLSGCNSGNAGGITISDISIHKIGDTKSKVSYGMSRSEAEKVLGAGEKGAFGYEYESGVTIMYRDDKVVGIVLNKDAAYENPNLKIGMLKDELKKIYGNDFLLETPLNLDYAYDSINKTYLNESSPAISQEEAEKVYVVSVMFDENGYANRIMLLDQRMAMYLN